MEQTTKIDSAILRRSCSILLYKNASHIYVVRIVNWGKWTKIRESFSRYLDLRSSDLIKCIAHIDRYRSYGNACETLLTVEVKNRFYPMFLLKKVRLFAQKWITSEPMSPYTSTVFWTLQFISSLRMINSIPFSSSQFYFFLFCEFYRKTPCHTVYFSFFLFFFVLKKKTRRNTACAASHKYWLSNSKQNSCCVSNSILSKSGLRWKMNGEIIDILFHYYFRARF